jgi:multimeric flavodoxin WrbA
MRKNGATRALLNRILEEMQRIEPWVSADVIHVADLDVAPCRVTCSDYCSRRPYRCSIADDLASTLEQMVAADALLIGSPLYFRGPPAKFQALIERLISLFFFQESQGKDEMETVSPLLGKPCGLLAVAEYSNPHGVLEYLHDFCTVLKMRPVRLDYFPYLGVAGQGELDHDQVFNPFERSAELARKLVGRIQ